jgi:hypothetical protein
MAAGELQAFKTPERTAFSAVAFILSLIAFIGALTGVALSPAVLQMIYSDDRDYAMIGNVGQAYGGASAVVASVALFVVAGSVYLQYRQLRAAHVQSLAEFNEELVLLAMENPKYRQCWGARISPEGVDEELFYYCSKVVKLYTKAWELRNIDETQAREYLRNFFDSEIPRLYWRRHGDWHRRGHSRGHRERFRDLINDEYLRAVASGEPSRPHETYRPGSAPHRTTRSQEASDLNHF